MDTLSQLLAAAGLLFAALYLFFRRSYSHWARRGVPGPEPTVPVGNFGPVVMGRTNILSRLFDLASSFREVGYCGAYMWHKPALLVWEPEMVKQIITKDFASFHDRNQTVVEGDPLSHTLFNLSGKKWKNLRIKLTPAFTSGKLKNMFPLMHDIGLELVRQTALEAERSPAHAREVDMDLMLSHFSTDVIGSVAFGIQCNTLRDHENEFLSMSKKLFKQTLARQIRLALTTIAPWLNALLPMKTVFSDVHNFFVNLMRDTVEQRERLNVERNDFVQLMMQLRAADLSVADPENHVELTHGVMAAQGFIFFLAGLDNVSNSVGFALNRLAADQELQDRVAAEVRQVSAKHGGELSYDALREMELVKRVVLEGLRLWTPMGVLLRKCNATTRVGSLTVEKGDTLFLVTSVSNMDENIFPEPARFDPDRHTAENREQRHPYAFLPFGEGPRVCIAERFALLEMQLVVAILLQNFKFSPGPNYETEVELNPKAQFRNPKNGFPLKVTVRK